MDVRDGFSVGAIFAMAQTPDGYLWLGAEFGLFRFDGGHAGPLATACGQQLPQHALQSARDARWHLWIGTFEGLVSWSGGKLTYYPEIGKAFVTSLLEDRDGTVWVATFTSLVLPARVCAIRAGSVQCKGEDGAFGTFAWSLGEDSSGTLWVGADSGVWRWNPGPAQRYAMPGMSSWRPVEVRRRPNVDWNQRCRTQAADCGQARTVSYSQRDESECAACGPRGRFEQALAGP